MSKKIEEMKLEDEEEGDGYSPFDMIQQRKGTQVGTVNYMAPEMI